MRRTTRTWTSLVDSASGLDEDEDTLRYRRDDQRTKKHAAAAGDVVRAALRSAGPLRRLHPRELRVGV